MAESIFDDRSSSPTVAQVRRTLGRRAGLWEALAALSGEVCEAGDAAEEWTFYKKSTGWLLRLKSKKLTLCTLIPKADEFVVIFLMPERALEAALSSRLPRRIVEDIEAAKTSKFGTAFRVNVKRKNDLPAVRKLIEAKLVTA